MHTLIQYTLDKAEEMTGSKIGFFHFYSEDESSYFIQSGSTSTMAKTEMNIVTGDPQKLVPRGSGVIVSIRENRLSTTIIKICRTKKGFLPGMYILKEKWFFQLSAMKE